MILKIAKELPTRCKVAVLDGHRFVFLLVTSNALRTWAFQSACAVPKMNL